MSYVHQNNPAIVMMDIKNPNPWAADPSPIPKVVKYAWPGGYPMFYVTADGGVLSPEAVEDNLEDCCNPEDPAWYVTGHDANWEDPNLYCDVTGERIESAYAEPEETEVSAP